MFGIDRIKIGPVLPGRVVHCCYHKCLTVYFNQVFNDLAQQYRLDYRYLDRGSGIPRDADMLLFPHSELDPDELPPFRGTHVIRDPRDLLVSAYLYHLRTDEEWCSKPNPNHRDLPTGVSYQQHLNSLSREQGLLYELANVSGGIITNMGSWNYDDPRFLELRFEDVVGNERSSFARIFRWYGMPWLYRRRAVNMAESWSLGKMPGGDPAARHARKGSRRGQWQDFFTPRVKQEFKRRYGGVLIKLGYVADHDW